MRSDAKINTVLQNMADVLQVPVEAIGLKYPNGRNVRSDSNMEKVRRKWRDASGE